jgi:hypothetical protein
LPRTQSKECLALTSGSVVDALLDALRSAEGPGIGRAQFRRSLATASTQPRFVPAQRETPRHICWSAAVVALAARDKHRGHVVAQERDVGLVVRTANRASRSISAPPGIASRDRLRGWGERTRTRKCRFTNASPTKSLWYQNVLENLGVRPRFQKTDICDFESSHPSHGVGSPRAESGVWEGRAGLRRAVGTEVGHRLGANKPAYKLDPGFLEHLRLSPGVVTGSRARFLDFYFRDPTPTTCQEEAMKVLHPRCSGHARAASPADAPMDAAGAGFRWVTGRTI